MPQQGYGTTLCNDNVHLQSARSPFLSGSSCGVIGAASDHLKTPANFRAAVAAGNLSFAGNWLSPTTPVAHTV
jgi:hypothetical protein